MAEEQYLTEAHYLVCSRGAKFCHVKIDGKRTTKIGGQKAANAHDLQRASNFICAGANHLIMGVALVAGAASMLIPGPGWVVAAVIAAAVIAIMAIGAMKCISAAATRYWDEATVAQRVKIDAAHALTLSSQMLCPQEGGVLTAKPTFWSAFGSQALKDLGYAADFAFNFLAGRGAGAFIKEGASAIAEQGLKEGLKDFGKETGDFVKEQLKDQFDPRTVITKWNEGSHFCAAMQAFGIAGNVKQYADIWTDDDKSIWDKVQATGFGLVMSFFSAKGMTTVCFPAGTKVHTQYGLANIERLEVGVPVLTYNVETGKQEYKPIKKLLKRTTLRMCSLELSNGETLGVTPEHRFFSAGRWIPVEELEEGDTLQTKENVFLVIEHKAIIATFAEVFNLEIEDNENYYVTEDGLLVHNGCGSKGEAGTPEHKEASWQEYQDRGGELDYDAWSNKYDVAIQNPNKGNAAANQYQKDIGWGEREVTVDVDLNGETVNRRLDIADKMGKSAVEVKSGNYFSLTKDKISYEIDRDAELVRNGWNIEWHIDGDASQPLLEALKNAGITITR